MLKRLMGGLVVAAILMGVAACSAPAEATPVPTVTSTVTVTPAPVTKREYVETVKEVTPQVCIDTLNLMAQYLGLVSETGPLYGEGTVAAYARSAQAMEVVSGKLESIRIRLEGVSTPLKAAAEACRAKAKT